MRERVASENETGRWLVVESEIALKKIHAIIETPHPQPSFPQLEGGVGLVNICTLPDVSSMLVNRLRQ